MTSLLTNGSALTALQTLSRARSDLDTTQGRISTGLLVGSASDNAAYWSIATTMRSDNGVLSAVKDALSLGSATIDVAMSALTSSIDVVNQIKSKLIAAAQPGVDRTKIGAEISSLQKQLQSNAESATFSGQNWLSVDSGAANYDASKSVVASYSRDTAGSVSVSTIDIDTSKSKLYDANGQAGLIDKSRTVNTTSASLSALDITSLTDSIADQQALKDYASLADDVLTNITIAASDLGAAHSRIASQAHFISSLMDSVSRGIGSLVDADMNLESTRLQSLQVQQRLGLQSLSIANINSSMILKLFA